MIRVRAYCALALVAALAASACTRQAPQAAAEPAAPTAPQTLALTLPMVDVMRASVEIPADGIWELQAETAPTTNAWLLADQDAADILAAATLVSMPGTGADDAKRAASADWQMWASSLQGIAKQIRDAAKAKDPMAFSAAADLMTENCQACHDKYRPEVAADGISRYPFYPKRVPEKPAP